ncbi:MAG: SAM-dependent methyltransferase [Actinobacteria bacterium]|nr:SAM-dependent methyltransferase [Actinomycetota bacterium]
MPTLTTELREPLRRGVLEARRAVTEGVRQVVQRLAVDRHEPFGTMSIPERELRNRLRARGRQLGDQRDQTRGTQGISNLVAVAAYELWHRMLFARFLEANGLLFDPDAGAPVALSLDDVRDRANAEGRTWPEVAARFAQRLLPQIFRLDDPVFDIRLPLETTEALEKILQQDIPLEAFTSDDALGWVYQYWQSDEKDRVNRAGGKVRAADVPAVTQLFTEDYMVWFLLHNTLGAWWAGKVLATNPALAREAASEDALRAACALPGVDWEYLRFVREGDAWRPAAGTFADWPTTAREITVLDPCMGSGHFLIFALPIVAAMRAAEEGTTLAEATDAALRENVFGLELDPRCAQLAAFNLAVTAWRATGYRPLPRLNLACSGVPATGDVARWRDLGRGNPVHVAAMGHLHALFAKADVLGSLIDPHGVMADFGRLPFAELEPVLARAMETEGGDADEHELAVSVQGIARAATLLAKRYVLVATNVPFLGSNKQDEPLREHCAQIYPKSKADLATCFVERCLAFAGGAGTIAIVSPQAWLSLTNYRKFREQILSSTTWHYFARLGTGAFEGISGEVVNVGLLILSSTLPFMADGLIHGVDVSHHRGATTKASALRSDSQVSVAQSAQKLNPDARILLERNSDNESLSDYAEAGKGSTTGDSPNYLRNFWEFPSIPNQSVPWLNSPNRGDFWSGRSDLLRVPLTDASLLEEAGLRIHGQANWGHRGVAVRKTGNLVPFLYSGEVFDDNIGVFCPENRKLIPSICAYTLSGEYEKNVRKIDVNLKVTAATLVKVPFEADHWTAVASMQFSNGLPEPFTNDPTQWLFHGHPFGSVVWDETAKWTAHGPLRTDPSVLQVAVARLLGYRWPAELDPAMHLAAEQRKWVDRCETLLKFADSDGIVCLPSVKGERPAADRLADLLGAAYGDGWSDAILRDLVTTADPRARDLAGWLQGSFFKQHCETFEQRPFIWHVWDGEPDGFGALVNYHRLAGPGDEGYRTLQSLTYTYLGDWIERQRQEQAAKVAGADRRLMAASILQGQLGLILTGEAPYDLFVRWKPLHEQPIGWRPDIDDGVRVNIRPFMTARTDRLEGRTISILRHAPGIKWGMDRGTDRERSREDFPWSWGATGDETDFAGRVDVRGGGGFDGKRWNDMHYTLEAKRAARARQSGA